MGVALVVAADSQAVAASIGLGERYGYGFGYAMNQRRIAARGHAMDLRLAHHYRLVATRRMVPQSEGVALLFRFADTIVAGARQAVALIDRRRVEESCLANAVYFEARSESYQGQMAVAKVILNRVKVANFPSSVCAVVYQGADRPNACQFSFACDGKPDIPRPGRAYRRALAIADEVLSDDSLKDDEELRIVGNATHYHADYVAPRWSRSLTRLTKIGHHIFYAQG